MDIREESNLIPIRQYPPLCLSHQNLHSSNLVNHLTEVPPPHPAVRQLSARIGEHHSCDSRLTRPDESTVISGRLS